jgi:hypothetical protein
MQINSGSIGALFGLAISIVLAGCAVMSPQQARNKVEEMSVFEVCLAAEAKMDRKTFALAPEVVNAVFERVRERTIDCASHRLEVIQFLTRALRGRGAAQRTQSLLFRFWLFWGALVWRCETPPVLRSARLRTATISVRAVAVRSKRSPTG